MSVNKAITFLNALCRLLLRTRWKKAGLNLYSMKSFPKNVQSSLYSLYSRVRVLTSLIQICPEKKKWKMSLCSKEKPLTYGSQMCSFYATNPKMVL